jgi:hypothetical protein
MPGFWRLIFELGLESSRNALLRRPYLLQSLGRDWVLGASPNVAEPQDAGVAGVADPRRCAAVGALQRQRRVADLSGVWP